MNKFGLVFLILVMISGCTRGRKTLAVTAGPVVTETSLLVASTRALTATMTPPELSQASPSTYTTEPVETSTPAPAPTRTLGPNDPPYDKEGVKSWLVQAWQDGKPAEQVHNQLVASNWLADHPYTIQVGETKQAISDWQILDMNSDGRDEWLITPAVELSGCGSPIGGMWLVGEQGVWEWEDASLASPFGAALVLDQADFNGDGNQEVLAFTSDCLADTPTGAFFIFGLRDGAFIDLISLENDLYQASQTLRSGSYRIEADWPGPAITITIPSYEILDVTADGLPDLVLNGGTYHSVEAGQARPRSETWAWDGRSVSLQGIWWQPSGQRFDTLYDANLALELGDLAEAEGLYLQVLQDETLLDGVGLAPPEVNHASARQFAAFRLEVIGMLRGSLSAAQHYSDQLVAEYPDAPLTQAAVKLLDTWRTSIDLPSACQAAIDQLAGSDDPAGSLAEAGYGLPSLAAEDICPHAVFP